MASRDSRRFRLRHLTPALVVALCALGGTAQAQFFGDRYYNENGYGGGYQQRYQQPREQFNFPFGDRFMRPAPPPADYSKAPGPRKLEAPPTTNIVVIGDSLADWLAYGLDETYADQPDMGVVRKIKATSGLVRYDAKNETLDWAGSIKDTLAGERPNAIVVMLGLNDRQSLRDRIPPKPVPAKPGEAQSAGQAAGQAPGQAAAGAAGAAASSKSGARQSAARTGSGAEAAARPKPSTTRPAAGTECRARRCIGAASAAGQRRGFRKAAKSLPAPRRSLPAARSNSRPTDGPRSMAGASTR